MSRALFALVAFFALEASGGPVWLSLPTEAPCGFDAMSSALKARLAKATVANGVSPGADDVQISLVHEGDGWTLSIVAPGQPELRRPLGDATDCVAFSEEAALIADRFLQSIQWSAGAPVTPLPPPEPPLPWSALLELGGGPTLGLTGLSGGGALGLGARRSGWQVEIDAAFLGTGSVPLSTTTPTGASLHQYTAAAEVMLGRHLRFGLFALRLELGGGAELYFVSPSPDSSSHPNPLPHAQLTLTPLGFGAARLGFELALTPHLFLALGAQARLHFGQARFTVEGYPQHFVTHLVDGDVGLSAGYVFF